MLLWHLTKFQSLVNHVFMPKKSPSIALVSFLCLVLTQKHMLDYSRKQTLPKSVACTYILNKQIACITWTNFPVFLDICLEFPLKIIWRKIILKIKDLPCLSSQLFTMGQLLWGWPFLHFTPIPAHAPTCISGKKIHMTGF